MRKIKKYNIFLNENKDLSNDIFDDVDNLKDLLTEFSDIGFNYSISHVLFFINPSKKLEWLGKVYNFDKYRGSNENELDVCAYLIKFEELFESEVATTYIEKREGFSIPNNRYFIFQEKIKYIQGVIESMGYIFSMSIRQSGYFEFLILEKKY